MRNRTVEDVVEYTKQKGLSGILLAVDFDDMTCFLSDKGSYISLLCILEDFGECSGLKVNHECSVVVVTFMSRDLWNHVLCGVRHLVNRFVVLLEYCVFLLLRS